jgi:hypothetical protein
MSNTPRPCIGPSSLLDKGVQHPSPQCTEIVCRNIDFRLIRRQRLTTLLVDFETLAPRNVP